ncbi:hypothetical protein [Piscinibacter sakaiensis]|uniref:hypothetical protein n=1 Tax=Piscinibacter sakaiensis TaxID=1547922 RepID=UPI003AAF3242
MATQRCPGRVHFNLALQQANTLLHDGHAWTGFARAALGDTRRALRSGSDLLVHASCSFIRGEPALDPLRSIAQVIAECEHMVLSSSRGGIVVRLGYLYGPTSQDLQAYRRAFRLGRPYWAGPRDALQDHLHHDDAIAALLAAARPQHLGQTFYATDGRPLPFIEFMDGFAHRIGRACPMHVPRLASPLMRMIVHEEHMQQTALSMPATPPQPMVPDWSPRFSDYREGLDQVVASWDD